MPTLIYFLMITRTWSKVRNEFAYILNVVVDVLLSCLISHACSSRHEYHQIRFERRFEIDVLAIDLRLPFQGIVAQAHCPRKTQSTCRLLEKVASTEDSKSLPGLSAAEVEHKHRRSRKRCLGVRKKIRGSLQDVLGRGKDCSK